MRLAIIGGDRRMLYAAQAFIDAGDRIGLAGFDTISVPDDVENLPLREALFDADAVILPVRPIMRESLNAPYAAQQIELHPLAEAIGDRPVFCGDGGIAIQLFSGNIYDYTAREDFCIRNAVLTAEGTLGLIVREYEGSVFGSKVLITGYGRIGRITARYLKALGADVTAALRSITSRAWAHAEGIAVCDYSLEEINRYDILINTVPAPVLTSDPVDRIRRDALIIDLASSPGGVDRSRAAERGVRCIHALGLPGKTAPRAAGRIIQATISNIIKEENGGKDHSGLCDDRLLLHL